ncbi:MAG: hypothetical protein ACRC62_08990 [Microcoleus sp.]
MGILKRLFGATAPKTKPIGGTFQGPFATKEEAIAAAKAEIDRSIANKSRDTSNSGESK